MAYCPICGDEYIDGVTRCPEHDVELVDEPPELDQEPSWVDRVDHRGLLKITFIVFLLAALVYAVSGAVSAVLLGLLYFQRSSNNEMAAVFGQVQSAAFPVAISCLGILAAALLLRVYLVSSETYMSPSASVNRSNRSGVLDSLGPQMMRLLLALTIMFALLWAGTGIATSQQRAESRANAFPPAQRPEDDAQVILFTLNYAAYTGGVACLAIMGAGLMMRAYSRLDRSENPEL